MTDPDTFATVLPIRAYARPTKRRERKRRQPAQAPSLVLVLDTESRTDPAQALTFASARLYEAATGLLRREWLVAGNDLTDEERDVLRAYVEAHLDERGRRIRLLSRDEFAEQVLWKVGYRAEARIVGHNIGFDLARLAIDWRVARGSAAGGFSLRFFGRDDGSGRVKRHPWRPDITVKALGSKRQLFAFTTPSLIDPSRATPGGVYRGRFLDTHQLAYALTDRSYTLNRAASAFGLGFGKQEVERHGEVSESYVDYCRTDVALTWALYRALIAEWERHPIALAPEQAFSPATVGRAYLRAMGIRPPLERQPDFPPERLGQAMTAYYGGRAEVRIRRVPLPVVYTDYTSMYPTTFELLCLWPWVIGERFEVDDATEDVRRIVATLERSGLHDAGIWPALAGVFCLVEPSDELLPARAPYGADPEAAMSELTVAPTIGLNGLRSATPLWYPLADLLVAKLLGGQAPRIREAFRVRPVGIAPDLRSVMLRGQVTVDPRRESLFRLAIEERKRRGRDDTLPPEERERLGLFLKTLANAASYGLYAQYDQLEPRHQPTPVVVDGLWHFDARVHTPEEPGEFCFPPLAATITAGARLLLALLQADVEARGGTYVACDTDSLIIVASRTGGLGACPGGPQRLPDGREAVCALSWDEVDEVIGEINRLNPYDRDAIPSLLKLEDENYALDGSGERIELWCIAVSAKRYVLYERRGSELVIRKASSHGLGLYRRPTPDPEGWRKEWPAWIEEVWRRIINELDGTTETEPSWFDLPAVGQASTTTPALMTAFAHGEVGLPYAQRMKPFNFMLIGHVDPFAPRPGELLGRPLTLVAPYTSDPGELGSLRWRNRYDGRAVEVTTVPGGEPGKVRLKTIGDVVRDYRLHPEVKSGDPRGGPCLRGTAGYLPRRHVLATTVRHIGKESNRLDEVEDGMIEDVGEVYVEYRDERGEWERALPGLRRLRDERGWRALADASGLSERGTRYALNGGRMPRASARARLLALVGSARAESPGRLGRVIR